MFTAQKKFENGHEETEDFATYEEACKWLATSPEAGINMFAGDNDELPDFGQIQSDVEYWQQ